MIAAVHVAAGATKESALWKSPAWIPSLNVPASHEYHQTMMPRVTGHCYLGCCITAIQRGIAQVQRFD